MSARVYDVCICIYIYISLFCIYIYMHVYVYGVWVCKSMSTYGVYIYIYTDQHTYTYIYIYTYMYVFELPIIFRKGKHLNYQFQHIPIFGSFGWQGFENTWNLRRVVGHIAVYLYGGHVILEYKYVKNKYI